MAHFPLLKTGCVQEEKKIEWANALMFNLTSPACKVQSLLTKPSQTTTFYESVGAE
jgi:hypothetical protein